MPNSYYLARHAYVCVANGQVVLLDLRRGKYIGLGRASSALLARYVDGWPAVDGQRALEQKSGDERAKATLTRMIRMGLVTDNPSQGHSATPTVTSPASRTLFAADLEARPTVTPGFGVCLFRACIAAARDLRLHRFEKVASRLRDRRTTFSKKPSSLDEQPLFKLVEAYVYARPFFFSARNACMYDSRALLELLYYHHIFPTWTFGIHTDPFLAHCWLQLGDLVVNDTVENVSQFTPILTV